MRRSLGLPIVCALAIASGACGNNNSSATAPTTPTPMAGTETFTATMAPGGTLIHQFTTAGTGTVNVTLLTTDPPSTRLGLGIGIPGANVAGGCDLTKTIQAQAGATPQLTATVEAGTYCAGAFDIGTVGVSGVVVGMSVQHP